MKYQGRSKLFISVSLTIFFILLSLVLFIFIPEARGTVSVIASLLIIVALIINFIAYREVERIRSRVSNLPSDYQSVYFEAHELTGTYVMFNKDKEEINNMILEIFEHSSLDGRDVNEVIGKNITSFVEGFVTEVSKPHSIIRLFSNSTSLFIAYLLLIKAYGVLRTGNLSMKTIRAETFDLGIFVTYFIISYICIPWLILNIQRSIKYRWKGIKRLQILFPVILSIGLFLGLIVMNEVGLGKYINRPINLFSNLGSILMGIFLLIGSFVIARVQKN